VVLRRIMRRFSRYLSVRLFVITVAVVAITFSISTYLNIRYTTRHLTEIAYQCAYRISDGVKRATRYDMLLNHRDHVQQLVAAAGRESGVVGVRIYDKSGVIVFSSDSLEIGRKVDFQAEACRLCHASGQPLRSDSVPRGKLTRVYKTRDGVRVLGYINPINNEPACYNASCHAHKPDQTILGVLDVMRSLANVDEYIRKTSAQMVVSTAVVTVVISILTGLFIYFLVRKPIRKLVMGMHDVASGNLETRIKVSSEDELGELANSFNKMSDELKKARDELDEWGRTLEDRIAEKTEELQRVQSRMIHMEKMVSLGKLSATVAHEINNPLFSILTYSKLISREVNEQKLDESQMALIQKHLSMIQKESSRCGEIVKNLLLFAKKGGGELGANRLNPLIEDTLALLEHHCEMQHVEVVRNLCKGEDEFICDADQVKQALMAICINAIEAMPDGGQLTVKTECLDSEVEVQVSDTGVGIPEDVGRKIFEPFFSTKVGMPGVGLGLSVVYGIIQRHKGSITYETQVGKGTTFTIRLPKKPEIEDEDEDAGASVSADDGRS